MSKKSVKKQYDGILIHPLDYEVKDNGEQMKEFAEIVMKTLVESKKAHLKVFTLLVEIILIMS